MKCLVIGLCAAMMITTSLANGKENHTKTIAWSARTVTKSDTALVKLPRIIKPKVFRSNPHRLAYFNSHWDDNDDIDIDDDAKITGPRREQYGHVKAAPTPDDPEGDITDPVRWRLFLARTAAMLRYYELHG